jgi:hypothetical protein
MRLAIKGGYLIGLTTYVVLNSCFYVTKRAALKIAQTASGFIQAYQTSSHWTTTRIADNIEEDGNCHLAMYLTCHIQQYGEPLRLLITLFCGHLSCESVKRIENYSTLTIGLSMEDACHLHLVKLFLFPNVI